MTAAKTNPAHKAPPAAKEAKASSLDMVELGARMAARKA